MRFPLQVWGDSAIIWGPMDPIIGISCSTTPSTERYYLPRNYVEAVEDTGGIPLLLPPLKSKEKLTKYLELIHGLLLSGGADVDPWLYGEESTPGMRRIDPEKDGLELELGKLVVEKGLPVLGICRGCQMLNVICGGSLSQRMEGLKHWQSAPESYPTHEIEIVKGTKLREILKEEKIRVNTFHRQSIKDVAPGFIISATAKDGVIEGIESKVHPFVIAVQFHAEWLWRDYPVFRRIFAAFVEAARSKEPPSQESSQP